MSLHGGRQWRTLRLRILHRDGYQCQINGPGCTHTADQVDHIVRLSEGGAKYDPRNLRAACTHCNASDGATHGNTRRVRRVSRAW
jgi:5-methylcytosine-specific restriction enzyme A